MKISSHSKTLFMDSLRGMLVPTEYGDPLFNYLVYGIEPGGFWTAALANDFISAMRKSHPANTITHLKNAVSWIEYYMPKEAWGSYEKVNAWLNELDEAGRRTILEDANLVFTKDIETWMVLKDDTNAPLRELINDIS